MRPRSAPIAAALPGAARRCAALLVLGVLLVPAARADAYRLQGHRWFSRTLTYYDATGRYGPEVRAAARAWNRSGARVHVRRATRRAARVIIRVDRRLGAAGEARIPVLGGVASRATVRLRADLERNFASKPERRAGITAVIAHELGHVLGLGHENRRCALMNSVLWSHCRSAGERWRYRCRTLERDDVRGLVRRYGGRVRRVAKPFCAAEPAPPAPVALAATTVDAATGSLRLTWQMGAGRVATVRVLRRAGACPTGPDDPAAELVDELETGPGRAASADDFVAPGVYCYAVVGLGSLGRPGPAATVAYQALGAPPQAEFTWFESDPLAVEFSDLAFDRDGSIVAWRWDFGDGTASTETDPAHVYPAPGAYTVTLTVTDDSGQTGAATQVVEVR